MFLFPSPSSPTFRCGPLFKHCLLRRGWLPAVPFQVHSWWLLVGSGYNDHCGLRWHDVRIFDSLTRSVIIHIPLQPPKLNKPHLGPFFENNPTYIPEILSNVDQQLTIEISNAAGKIRMWFSKQSSDLLLENPSGFWRLFPPCFIGVQKWWNNCSFWFI